MDSEGKRQSAPEVLHYNADDLKASVRLIVESRHKTWDFGGRPGEIRTLDQWIKSPLLFRLSYGPTNSLGSPNPCRHFRAQPLPYPAWSVHRNLLVTIPR